MPTASLLRTHFPAKRRQYLASLASLSFLGGASFTTIGYFAHKAWPALYLRIEHNIVDYVQPKLHVFLSDSFDRARHLVDLHPWIGLFVVGAIFVPSNKKIRHFYLTYVVPCADEDVLRPIGPPLAIDPLWGPWPDSPGVKQGERALAWYLPKDGNARAAWNALASFFSSAAGDGRQTWSWKPHEPFVAFRWTILAGRSGSGKSRMAIEYFRRELSRHESNERRNQFGRWRAVVGEWGRRQFPPASRKATDSWDIGLIRASTSEDASYSTRLNLGDKELGPLAEWFPRRPTALLLDDPRPGDSIQVRDALRKGSRKYRFPVRLVIVNQTLPSELFSINDRSGIPGNFGVDYSDPVILSGPTESIHWSKEDIFQISRSLPGAPQQWRRNDPMTGQILELLVNITQGNTLLVELALRHISSGKPIEGLTAEALVRERAYRVLSAFRQSIGNDVLTEEAIPALACIAIAGSTSDTVNSSTQLERSLPSPKEVLRKFQPIFRSWLNVENIDHLPAVRPERVADAFVRLILHGASYESQSPAFRVLEQSEKNWIIEEAWRWSVRGTLRTVARCSAVADELGVLLRLDPPQDVEVDPLDHAMAYVTAAVGSSFVQPETEPAALLAYEKAHELLKKLNPEDSAEAMQRISKMLSQPQSLGRLRPFFGALLFFQAEASMEFGMTSSANNDATRELLKMNADAANLLEAAVEENQQGPIFQQVKHRIEVSVLYMESLVTRDIPGGELGIDLMRAQILTCACAIRRILSSFDLCLADVEKVDEIAGIWPVEKFTSLLQRAWLLACAAMATVPNAAKAEAVARRIDRLDRDNPSRSVRQTRSEAWRQVASAKALARNLRGTEMAAARVEVLSRAFPDDINFQRVRVGSGSSVALVRAKFGLAKECVEAANSVTSIASRFPRDEFIQYEQCATWSWASTALSKLAGPKHIQPLEDCWSIANHIEWIASHFLASQRIQEALAIVWTRIAVAEIRVTMRERRLMAAARVERIARQFQESPRIQYQCASSWQNALIVYAAMRDVERCRMAFERMEQIAAGARKRNDAADYLVEFLMPAIGYLCGAELQALQERPDKEILDQLESLCRVPEQFTPEQKMARELRIICWARLEGGERNRYAQSLERLDQLQEQCSGDQIISSERAEAHGLSQRYATEA